MVFQDPWGHYYFSNGSYYCFSTVMTSALVVKSTGGDNCWHCSQESNHASSHWIPLPHTVSPISRRLLKLLILLHRNKIFLMFWDRIGSMNKSTFAAYQSMTVAMRKSIYENALESPRHIFAALDSIFTQRRMTGRQTLIMCPWVFGRYFLETKESSPVTLSKITDSICYQSVIKFKHSSKN